MSYTRALKHHLNAYRLRLLARRHVVPGGLIYAARAAANARHVGLSFDDGPSPEHTPAVLDLLGAYGARATFFVVGERVIAHPELVAVAGRQHEIGNHSHTHPRLSTLSDEQIEFELSAAGRAIESTGHTAVLARPPWGQERGRFNRIALELGLATVMWSIDSGDTAGKKPGRIAANASRAKGGDILLFHDNGVSTDARLRALELALDSFKRRRIDVITVSELLGATQPRSATMRRAAP